MMHAHEALPWVTLLLLGMLHGANPGMGWLFAVALGFQEGSGRAVWRALGPLALGHALAVAAAVVALTLVGGVLPVSAIKYVVAASLILLGVSRLRRHRHTSAAGMRASPRELVAWSFLMASAHGAGLMVLPVLGTTGAHAAHAAVQQASLVTAAPGLAAPMIHTAGYLLATGLIAWLVFARLGLRKLTKWWINVDAIWAAALVGTGVIALF